MSSPPASSASGVNEPAAAWRSRAEPTGGAAGEETGEASASGAPQSSKDAPGRPGGTIAAEARTARADFHRAASRPAAAAGNAPGRSAALQAFFVANAGRGLLPSGETSGVLSPNLKTEES